MKEKIGKIFNSIKGSLPSGAQVGGAIQGVFGDKMPKRFATEMAFYADGKLLSSEMIVAHPHVVLFIHGSSDTESGWNTKNPADRFSERLISEFSVQPLYVRYNSGLAVSDNGEKLAQLCNVLVSGNKAIRRLSLVAHSMGGLVAHSAIYHSRAQALPWLKVLKQVFLLGTPHAGAPLAKIAEKGEQILQFIPNPFTLMAASVIGLRSRGLKDLSRGQSGLPAEGKVLLPGVKYVFIAGGLQKKPNGFMNRIMGDGMVRAPSATQAQSGSANWLTRAIPWLKKSAEIHVESLPGVNHLALRNAANVYAVIRRYFKP